MGVKGKGLMRLNEQHATNAKSFHDFMGGSVRILEVFEGGTRDDDIELLFAGDGRKTMHVCDDIDINSTREIGAEIFARVGNPGVMSSGARSDGPSCAQL
jgi:hypothetical protein